MKKLITTIPYDKVKFKWICNHWDVHLNGTCLYNGELCEFENDYPEYNEENDEWSEMMVRIYQLDIKDKLMWMKRQWSFEKCVGYHWSYDNNGKRGKNFHYRKPTWFYKRLFNWYYNLTKKKKKL